MTRTYTDAERKWLEDYLRQRKADRLTSVDDEPDEGPESRLQAKIVAWAKEWGRPIQSNRQTRRARTLLTPGWPDITLILPGGRVLFIELKAGKGRLSHEQKQMKLQFMALGHEICEVRSYRRFLEIAKEAPPNSELDALKPETNRRLGVGRKKPTRALKRRGNEEK